MVIHVRRGKGNKDRYVLLGETMLTRAGLKNLDKPEVGLK
jgi:site-specific recombinase XerD